MSILGFKAKNHPQQTRYSGSNRHVDDRALPAEDFRKLNMRFDFTIDLAASPENAKLPRFYTEEANALAKDWAGERGYCNPPYSDIGPWIVKSWREFQKAELIVLLLPANRTEQRWWQILVEPYRDRHESPLRTEFISGRQRFLKPGQKEIGPNERPPFGLVMLIWRPAAVLSACPADSILDNFKS